ncbi:hypothetical protein K438DRAFT_1997309 [Mycena galopus ATCC 62051]|nr:hypothetical protein K438DRAFT_1997309 [Mycena galopus ATCC 62051]
MLHAPLSLHHYHIRFHAISPLLDLFSIRHAHREPAADESIAPTRANPPPRSSTRRLVLSLRTALTPTSHREPDRLHTRHFFLVVMTRTSSPHHTGRQLVAAHPPTHIASRQENSTRRLSHPYSSSPPHRTSPALLLRTDLTPILRARGRADPPQPCCSSSRLLPGITSEVYHTTSPPS